MKQVLDLTVMMYHYIRDPGDEAERGSGIAGFSVQAFEAQLDALSRTHNFVTWDDVRTAIQEDQNLPHPSCLLTFDDGVRDHYFNVFRVLRDRHLSGLFFVLDRSEDGGLVLGHKIHFLLAKMGPNALRDAIWSRLDLAQRELFVQAEFRYRLRYPGSSTESNVNVLKAVLQREFSVQATSLLSDLFAQQIGSEEATARQYYLNLEQIREMSAGGMYFGGHSRSHPWFDWIDAEARSQEIQASGRWLQRFDAGPWAFAYPYGGLSDDSPALLQKHGFVAGLTTREQIRHSDPYYIGRLDGEEFTQDEELHV